MVSSKVLMGVASFSLAILLLSGCEREGPAERAGEQMDEAAEGTRRVVPGEGPVERAGKEVDDAVEAAGDKIEDAGDKIERETNH